MAKTCILQIRVTPQERAAFKELAKSENISVTEFILQRSFEGTIFAKIARPFLKKSLATVKNKFKKRVEKELNKSLAPTAQIPAAKLFGEHPPTQSQSAFAMANAGVKTAAEEIVESKKPKKAWCGLKGMKP